MNPLKKLFKELNKKGVSATVITIILLVVGLAILMVFIISVGRTGGENIGGITETLEGIKHGI